MQTLKKYTIPMILLTLFSITVLNKPITKVKKDYENVCIQDFNQSIEQFNKTYDGYTKK